jgi:hypothetical protein
MTQKQELIQYFNVLAQKTIQAHDDIVCDQDTSQLYVRPETCVRTPKGLVVMGFNPKKQRWQVKLGRRLIAWNDNRRDFAQVGSFIVSEFVEAAE